MNKQMGLGIKGITIIQSNREKLGKNNESKSKTSNVDSTKLIKNCW